MRVNTIGQCCGVDLMKNGTDVESAYREVDRDRI